MAALHPPSSHPVDPGSGAPSPGRWASAAAHAGVAVALFLFAAVAAEAYRSMRAVRVEADALQSAHNVADAADSLVLSAAEANNASRGYAITGEAAWLRRFEHASSVEAKAAARLRSISVGVVAVREGADSLSSLVAAQAAADRGLIEAGRGGGAEAAYRLLRSSEALRAYEAIRRASLQIDWIAKSDLRRERASLIRNVAVAEAVVFGGGGLAFAILVVALFIRLSVEQVAYASLAAAQAELERFFTVSLDFLAIAGPDGYFKRINPSVTEVLGWTVEEFLSRPYLDLVHPEDRDATMREVERQLVRGGKVLHFENRYRHKDGTWRVLSWRSVPHADGLMYGAARDVTENRRAEEEIRRLNAGLEQRAAQVEAANRELEAFSYSVSHDLRAPLRHVQGYIGLLNRELGPNVSENGRRCLDTISSAAREMGELIDGLLSFARMARTEMNRGAVPLRDIVEEVRGELDPAEAQSGIRWNIRPLPVAFCDRAMMKRVVANLLGNAVKYTRGRRPAEIEVGCLGEEDGSHVVYVRDNGVGFDMKYADKLFGVFQRLHRSDEFEGNGIGLANVKRIVVRHGGRVWADARPGAGATFYFTVPAGGAPSHDPNEPKTNSPR